MPQRLFVNMMALCLEACRSLVFNFSAWRSTANLKTVLRSSWGGLRRLWTMPVAILEALLCYFNILFWSLRISIHHAHVPSSILVWCSVHTSADNWSWFVFGQARMTTEDIPKSQKNDFKTICEDIRFRSFDSCQRNIRNQKYFDFNITSGKICFRNFGNCRAMIHFPK